MSDFVLPTKPAPFRVIVAAPLGQEAAEPGFDEHAVRLLLDGARALFAAMVQSAEIVGRKYAVFNCMEEPTADAVAHLEAVAAEYTQRRTPGPTELTGRVKVERIAVWDRMKELAERAGLRAHVEPNEHGAAIIVRSPPSLFRVS